MLRLDKTLPGEMQDRMEELQRQRGENLSGLTMQQLRHRLHQEIENGYDFSMRSMLANTSAGLWHQFLELAVKKAIPEGAMTVTSDLQAGSGNVVSAEYGYRLLDLARVARDDADARKLLEADPLVGLQWRQLPEQSPFRRQMEQFIADFGHRGVYEVDMGNPRWVEDPTYVLKHVRELLYTDTNESFETLGQQRREKAEQTVARHTFFLRPLIRWLARRARHGAALREAAKSTLVSYLEPCRNIVLEVGRRMHEANIIADANDVIYLTWIEVDAFMSTWWDGNGAKALIHDRKVQRKTWLTEEPPDVITDDAPTYAPEPSTAGQPDVPVSGSTLRGTGVAAGVASGRVRILRHPDEGHQLKAGEILVAPSTDPGWTPLFMRAAAIAMEVGGYHSHGAIVAREFGIPAVANIPGLLSALRDGDTVTVHGDDGTIHWTVPR